MAALYKWWLHFKTSASSLSRLLPSQFIPSYLKPHSKRQQERFRTAGAEQLLSLFEGVSDLVQRNTPNGQINYANAAWLQALGHCWSDLQHKSWLALLNSDTDRNRYQQAVYRAGAEGKAQAITLYIQDKTGRAVQLRGKVHIIQNSGTEEIWCLWQAQSADRASLVEQKVAETTLKQQPDYYRQAVENSPNAIFLVDRNSQIQLWNIGCERAFQHGQEICGELVQVLLPENHPEPVEHLLAQVWAGETLSDLELRYRCWDGSQRLMVSRIYPLFDEQGNISRAAFANTDITERKLAIAALRDSEERYQTVIAAMHEGIVLQDAEGRIQTCNASAERILGLTIDQMCGRTSLDPRWRSVREDGSPFPGDEHPAMVTLHTGESVENVIMGVYKPNGFLTWISINSQPLFRTGETRPYAVVSSFSDITEQRTARAELQSSEARYRAIVEDQTELVCRFLPNGNLTFVNDAYCEVLGIPREELLGYNYQMFLLALDQGRETDLMKPLTPSNPVSLIETQVILPNGEMRWQQWSNRAILDTRGNIVEYQAVGRDITERKQIETNMRLQTERSRLFAEITLKIRQSLQLEEILNTTVTEVQKLLQANRVLVYKLQENGGRVVMEAVTQQWDSLHGLTFEMDCPKPAMESLQQGKAQAIADVTKGVTSPCMKELMMQWRVRALLVVPIIQRETLWGLLIVHQCDRTRHWSTGEVALLQQLGDQVGIALSQSQLVDSLRRSEEEILKALAKERELGELKSRFVSMVSHEFRTPLTTIQSSTELLQHYEWTPEEEQERFEQIHAAVKHMTQLLEDVLLIGKAEAGQLRFNPELIDLTNFCQQSVTDLQFTAGKKHCLTFETLGQETLVWCDLKLLRQILSNLLFNAVKYSPEGGNVDLVLKYLPGNVELEVSDQGIGIPEAELHQLFEAFFRATNVETIQGTGLGLTIVKRCVDLHRGSIRVNSQVGVGTTFTITLPLNQPWEE